MSDFQPTLLLGLDPHSIAICHQINQRFKQQYSQYSPLVKVGGILCNDTAISLIEDIANYGDFEFDLKTVNVNINYQQITSFFKDKNKVTPLQQDLTTLIQSLKKLEAINQVQEKGINVSNQTQIYVIVSCGYPANRTIIRHLISLLKWIINNFFSTQSHSIDAIILCPELFENAMTGHYAETYALLKTLEYLTLKSHRFNNHWLLSSTNERGIFMGSFKDYLDSYTDALIGFILTEKNNIIVALGNEKVRNQLLAYSTFGYGELFYPVQTIIERFGLKLAEELIPPAFLQTKGLNDREILLEAKKFISHPAYKYPLEDITSIQGKEIWQDFTFATTPKPDLNDLPEFFRQLEQQYREFETQKLLSFKQQLEASSEEVKKQLNQSLKKLVETFLNESSWGLEEVYTWLITLINRNILIQEPLIGESPANLRTEYRNYKAKLDILLEVNLQDLQDMEKNILTTIFEINERIKNINLEIQSQEQLGQETKDLIEKLNPLKQQLIQKKKEYQDAILKSNRIAETRRQEKLNALKIKYTAKINDNKAEIPKIIQDIEKSKSELKTLEDERKKLLNQYAIFYPILGIIIFALFCSILILISVKFNITVPIVLTIFYWMILLLKCSPNLLRLNDTINAKKREIDSFKNRLNAKAYDLRKLHNEQLRLEYDCYVQQRQINVLDVFLEMVTQETKTLQKSISQLKEISQEIEQTYQELTPINTRVRQSIITQEDMNIYYDSQFSKDRILELVDDLLSNHLKRFDLLKIGKAEIKQKLLEFSKKYFEDLKQISIEQLILGQHPLLSQEKAQYKLFNIYEIAQSLCQLTNNDPMFNLQDSRDATLSVKPEYSNTIKELLEKYIHLNLQIVNQANDSIEQIKILTRCCGFPAYFLGNIGFYRGQYFDQLTQIDRENQSFPDLVPLNFHLSSSVQESWKILLLGIAFGLVQQRDENYFYQHYNLGDNRKTIASDFIHEFTVEEYYDSLQKEVQSFEQQYSPDDCYNKVASLQELLSLQGEEIQIFNDLLNRYSLI